MVNNKAVVIVVVAKKKIDNKVVVIVVVVKKKIDNKVVVIVIVIVVVAIIKKFGNIEFL
jgi:hypothetical protein